ncbi:hypothetical protein PVK06_045529 [Gossypium arboreum]|uniref:Uncharacterized protein n=1 Tax=Gossypium arboreum TaxID=29729 RepID=A0ABR0MUT5_GOSAR|nr:hypothetical protein PVK06_045529 [Gossypium arboreum]
MQNWDHPSIQWDLRNLVLYQVIHGTLANQQDDRRRCVLGMLWEWVYGWAAVVRNDSSDFVRCISYFMKITLDPFQSEIHTVRETFYWLKSLHLDNIATEIGS